MKEYVDREKLLQDISETVLFTIRGGVKTPTPEMRGANKVIDRIKSAKAADVVEVVRCKYCKHSSVSGKEGECDYVYCDFFSTFMTVEGYCHCGVKMDGKGEGE